MKRDKKKIWIIACCSSLAVILLVIILILAGRRSSDEKNDADIDHSGMVEDMDGEQTDDENSSDVSKDMILDAEISSDEGDVSEGDTSQNNSSKGDMSKNNNSKGDTAKGDASKNNSTKGDTSKDNSSNSAGSSGGNSSVQRPDINFAPSGDGSSSGDSSSGGSSSGGSSSGTESKYPKIAGGKITCDSFGRYTGQYVEDGRDELVESVAAVLVTNKSSEYLEYATLTFDVDGSAANFIVTGLPAGASAWVMDANKLEIGSGASFTYQNCSSQFRTDVDASSDEVELKADGNMLTATNKTDQTMNHVVVYYRVMHTDGNYLGGITYTVNFDTLGPGESKEVLAGHYSAADSEIVRVSWSN